MTGNEKASQKRGFTIYIQVGRKIFSQHVYRSLRLTKSELRNMTQNAVNEALDNEQGEWS